MFMLKRKLIDMTSVHKAASHGNINKLSKLICEEDGRNINIKTPDGLTPLHEAAYNGQYKCVAYLIEYGADVNAHDVDGVTPLSAAATMGFPRVVKLLLDSGALVNSKLMRSSALHGAAFFGSPPCLNILLAAGADIEATDCDVGTPLHASCYLGNFEAVHVLLRYGAAVNAIHIHRTPLHCAVAREKLPLIKLLVDYGSDVYAKDNQGRKASELCPENSPIQCFLKEIERTPRSLKYFCKQSIRKHVKFTDFEHLRLPPSLISLLLYEQSS